VSSENAVGSSFKNTSVVSRDRLPRRTWLLLAYISLDNFGEVDNFSTISRRWTTSVASILFGTLKPRTEISKKAKS